MNELQKQVIDYIRQFVSEKGYAPTVREIAAALGGRSISHIQQVIDVLVKNGRLTRDTKRQRSIRVVESFDTFEDRAKYVKDEISRILNEHGMYIDKDERHFYLCDIKSNDRILV